MRLIDADALIEKCGGWYVEEGTESGFIGTLKNILATMPTIQPVATDTNVGDKISKFIDGLEEIFADIRERHVDDSVCGLCEYDGAYMGQSGDWCNECPGFDRDDCFKLSDETRKKWADEIIKALPTVPPEPQWIPVSERLPEIGKYVLCYLKSRRYFGHYRVCIYRAADKYINHPYFDFNENGFPDVIAWMPLPEPYKPNNK